MGNNLLEFEKEIEIKWSDCDANQHVRHSSYYDFGAHCRIRFFNSIGFGADKMKSENIGPILFKEECTFLKELHLDETITVNLLKDEISEDGSKWKFHHEIFNQKKQKSAHLTVSGAWIDLGKRKLTAPPIEFSKMLHQLRKGSNFIFSKKT